MVNSTKRIGLRAAALALAATSIAGTAVAQDYGIQCYPYTYTGYAPEIATPYKTEDDAHAAAIVVWQDDITKHLGKIWADWGIATERALDCVEKDDGYGGYVYLCNVVGYPCYKPIELPHVKPTYSTGYSPPKKTY